MTIITALALLRRVDAKQPYELGAELNGIAIYDLEAWLRGRSDNRIVVCFRVSCGGQYQAKETEPPH